MMSEDQLKYLKILGEEGDKKYRLTGMYKDWYLEYASYTNLDRAIPHIIDGLKPVQRRILHSMKRMDDGRYNKVANIIGHTMQFHPHGDASIGQALVQLGQKGLLVDTQGNWGNILTGDPSAAPRYIEARLSKFALEVAFNNKITEWKPSYDGRNQEPVALPVKFPLLLAQGTQGIGVGLASLILPHNFNELLDACISHLKGEDFVLYPDFPTGGLMDVRNYNSGLPGRNSRVKVRACIEKRDKKTLAITELPFGCDSQTLIKSIIAANDNGKIRIRRIDDNTAENVELIISLANDISPDKTIDALYAFTLCESSISPNACVVIDNKPKVMSVEAILRYNAERTRNLLQTELNIHLNEAEDDWHYSSLEKIFFEEKIYRLLEDDSRTWEDQLAGIEKALRAFEHLLRKPIKAEDVARLVEKPVRKISKFDIKKADEHIKGVEADIARTLEYLAHITDYTINYFKQLKEKYGSNFPRRTKIINFENIEATKVVAINAKLYVNKEEGFLGMDLKKDENAEYICDCSDLDEIIVFMKNGQYMVTKVSAKSFVGKNIIHAAVFKKNDSRTTYNVAYRDGKTSDVFVKRFSITGVTRDKMYDITQGKDGSQLLWFSSNPNGEVETIKVYLKARPKLKKLIYEYDFATLAVKGRGSRGNLLSRYPIQKITLKEKGAATMGGQKIWFDNDIQRLSDDPRGTYLGEFLAGERILAINKNGTFYTTNFDLSNRYQEELRIIEKLDTRKIFSALYYDAEIGAYYLKRFHFESSDNQALSFIGEAVGSYLIDISEDAFPQVKITFGGKHEKRPDELIDVEEFIGEKSFRAKGKRATSFEVSTIEFIQPLEKVSADDPSDSEFELEGPVQEIPQDDLPNTEETNQDESPIDFHDEDAIQMTLL